MWEQSARIKWLKGNSNVRFFYHTKNCQRSKNHILLLEVDGVELSNQEVITNSFFNFFQGLTGMSAPAFDTGVNWDQLYSARHRAPFLIFKEPFIEEEIRGVASSLGTYKTPGLDGST